MDPSGGIFAEGRISCVPVALFLRRYARIALFLVNPCTLRGFRETFDLARSKADRPDAQWLAEIVLTHHKRLPLRKPLDGDLALLELDPSEKLTAGTRKTHIDALAKRIARIEGRALAIAHALANFDRPANQHGIVPEPQISSD